MSSNSAVRIVFCADPLNGRQPDPAYQVEAIAVAELGVDYHLISYEALVDEQDAARAVRRVPEQAEPVLALYRGWMLRPEQYEWLFQALATRGLALINSPAEYALCHELPNWYPLLERWTPRSTWLTTQGSVSDVELAKLLAPFGDKPAIVKDFVKSRKHEWNEACFIPSTSDSAAAARVARRFLELQGPDLHGGIVIREYESFEPIGMHSKSGMPLTLEYRLFCLDGEPIASARYWEEGEYGGTVPPLEYFRPIAGLVRSRFFTLDVARQRQGAWRIVELGDGQVAGLPEWIDPAEFYRAILGSLTRSSRR